MQNRSKVMNNTEIERKYLLSNNLWRDYIIESHAISQAYLSLSDGNTIRIRRYDNQAFITIKSHPKKGSIARFEWEKEISLDDYKSLLPHAVSNVIEKTRHIVPLQMSIPLKIEIDEFHGVHEGLVLAEIELPSEDFPLTLPAFIGEEVTGDPRYHNSHLSRNNGQYTAAVPSENFQNNLTSNNEAV